MGQITHLYKLPRSIEAAQPGCELLTRLELKSRLLCEAGNLIVPVLAFSPQLREGLLAARRCGAIIRGTEEAAEVLHRERRGLELLKKKAAQGERISRLLLMADDGSKNFYRKIEGLLQQHMPRVLGCILECDSLTLGDLIFGQGTKAKLVLVGHKDYVSRILLSAAGD